VTREEKQAQMIESMAAALTAIAQSEAVPFAERLAALSALWVTQVIDQEGRVPSMEEVYEWGSKKMEEEVMRRIGPKPVQ
jgi:hypothetical protein